MFKVFDHSLRSFVLNVLDVRDEQFEQAQQSNKSATADDQTFRTFSSLTLPLIILKLSHNLGLSQFLGH
jgi:hypothetical protein